MGISDTLRFVRKAWRDLLSNRLHAYLVRVKTVLLAGLLCGGGLAFYELLVATSVYSDTLPPDVRFDLVVHFLACVVFPALLVLLDVTLINLLDRFKDPSRGPKS